MSSSEARGWHIELVEDFDIVSGNPVCALYLTKVGQFKVYSKMSGSPTSKDIAQLLRVLAGKLEEFEDD